jgi:hypothetical protein
LDQQPTAIWNSFQGFTRITEKTAPVDKGGMRMENEAPKESVDTSDISSTLNTLLANENFIKNIRALLAQSQQSAAPSASTAPSSEDAPASAQKTDSEDPPQQGEILPPAIDLQQLLSNPEIMAKIPQVMAMLSPMMSSTKAEASNQAAETVTHKFNPKSRENLLCALKPFLSPHRQSAVDSIMRLSQLGQILQQLK